MAKPETRSFLPRDSVSLLSSISQKVVALDSPTFFHWAVGTKWTDQALPEGPPGRGKHKRPYKINTGCPVPGKHSSWRGAGPRGARRAASGTRRSCVQDCALRSARTGKGRDVAVRRQGVTGGSAAGPGLRRPEGIGALASPPEKPDTLSRSSIPSTAIIHAPRAHSQAGTSSRKSAFCVRSRCRSCRTMWLFQRAAGAPGPQGPAMAAPSRLSRAGNGSFEGSGGLGRGLQGTTP